MPSSPSCALRPSKLPSAPLADLAAQFDLKSVNASPAVAVSGVALSSAAIESGDLFAALPGAKAHGAHFAAAAIAAGAAAVLTDPAGAELIGSAPVPVLVHPQPRRILGEVSAEIYGHPSQRLLVIGITGTSGKTTTSYLVEAGLAASGHTTGLIGTIETRIAGVRVPSALTTPEAPQLQGMFAAMLERGVTAVVMEVSSHALALGRVDGTRFAVGAFTNLSQDHLDFHRDFDDYFAAKRLLFEPDSPVHARKAVVCIDDDWGQQMAAAVDRPVTVSTTGAADWTVSEATALPDGGQRFFIHVPSQIDGPGVTVPVRLRLPGAYNVANTLLAVAACTAAGASPAQASAALETVSVPGRVERIDCGQDFLAVVDYAHKPAALDNVIATLRAQITGRIAVVVGAGGDRDAAKRPLMGEAAARAADLLIVTDDNPRTENPAAIRSAVTAGAVAVTGGAETTEIADRAEAIAAAVAWARTGDAVLIAGKGHEAGQEINGVKYPFDDRDVLARALRAAAPVPGATA